jgi:hypothetical protein
MSVPVPSCDNCGKNFTTDDLRGTACKNCGTVLAHHRRAAQQVAVINQMMVDRNGNGIPDAFEPMVQNAQANAMNQAFGMAPGPTPMMPYGGYGMQNPYAQQQAQAAGRAAATAGAAVGVIMIVVIAVTAVLVIGGALAAFFLAR